MELMALRTDAMSVAAALSWVEEEEDATPPIIGEKATAEVADERTKRIVDRRNMIVIAMWFNYELFYEDTR